MGTSERFVTGSVVIINWPFSDLSGSKIRPAIVVAGNNYGGYILCQVTSQSYHQAAIELHPNSFQSGSLNKVSYMLYTQLFTADDQVVRREHGRIKGRLCEELVESIKTVLDSSLQVRLIG